MKYVRSGLEILRQIHRHLLGQYLCSFHIITNNNEFSQEIKNNKIIEYLTCRPVDLVLCTEIQNTQLAPKVVTDISHITTTNKTKCGHNKNNVNNKNNGN